MQTALNLIGLGSCGYTVTGTLEKDRDERYHHYVICMEYPESRFMLEIDIDKKDLDLSQEFAQLYIKKMKQLRDYKIDFVIISGDNSFKTKYCQIYHVNHEYFLCFQNDKMENWNMKFNSHFGEMFSQVLSNFLEEIEKLKNPRTEEVKEE